MDLGPLNNVEIKGLPASVKETVNELVIKVAEVAEVPLVLSEVDIAHTILNKKTNEVNLIISFTTRSKRNAFLTAARKVKLSSSELELSEAERQFYANEHLTPDYKRLLGSAIAQKKLAS